MSLWYEEHFQEDYLDIYKQRDDAAEQELDALLSFIPKKSNQRVLDLCCGYGRHTRFLASRGFNVTGVDLSAPLLREAINQSLNLPIQYMRCDMRKVPFSEEMDLVVNLFTSFGYFDEDIENEKVFACVSRSLKQYGYFIFDYLNPDFVIKELIPFSKDIIGDKEITQYRNVENGRVMKTINIKSTNSSEKNYQENVKLYRLSELKRMVERNNLTILQALGSYSAEPFDESKSPRMILICQKGLS